MFCVVLSPTNPLPSLSRQRETNFKFSYIQNFKPQIHTLILKTGIQCNKENLLTFNKLIKHFAVSSPSVALHLFVELLGCALAPDAFTIPPVLKASASIPLLLFLRATHALVVKYGLFDNPFVASALVSAYATIGLPFVAVQVLDELRYRDLATWNAAITGLSRCSEYEDAMLMLGRMMADGISPNQTTISCAASACSRNCSLLLGRAIHGLAIKLGDEISGDVSVNSALVFMYSILGELRSAVQVFGLLTMRNVVAFNSIIRAYAQNGEEEQAWRFFEQMLQEGFEPSEITLTSMLTVCSELIVGRMIHAYIIKMGMDAEDEIIDAALIDMYGGLGSSNEAKKVFDAVPSRCELSSWNSMILNYTKNGNSREALSLFNKLKSFNGLQPNLITLIGALSACAALGDSNTGKAIHDYITEKEIKMDVTLETTLIDMYANCGSVDVARNLFEEMKNKDLVSWSVMISGHGMNGQAIEAMQLFDRMVSIEGLRPDTVTFTAILSALSHAGMVQEGWNYFNMMKSKYGLEPQNEQYACMVDLLGRAGKLSEALDFITKMPINPNFSAWGALLGACRIYNNIELGVFAADKLLELNTEDPGYYVLLSNLYAAQGKWKDVTRIRGLMKAKRLQKNPGCSWVHLCGKMHCFYVGDRSHPQAEQIYKKLNELGDRIKELGYVAGTNLVLHDVDDEVKLEKLSSHSERLAIAFALINTEPGETIRVMKNLRICADCHCAIKLMAKATGRRIIVRDAYQFHHFEGGKCSCGDYW